jgi:hypothetical protein
VRKEEGIAYKTLVDEPAGKDEVEVVKRMILIWI